MSDDADYWTDDLTGLNRYKRASWYPITTRRKGIASSSKFSGAPVLYAGENWPHCPDCRSPMHLMLQINSADLPDDIGAFFGDGYLQLFYCIDETFGCEASESNYEAFSRGVLVRVVAEELGNIVPCSHIPVQNPFPEKAIIGWKKDNDYPDWTDAARLGISLSYDQAREIEVSGFPKTGDKLVGWPAWQQGQEYPPCPEGTQSMEYLLQLDSEDNLPYMFGDVGTAHIFQCKIHRDLLALQWAGG